jgi:hypothetical protein
MVTTSLNPLVLRHKNASSLTERPDLQSLTIMPTKWETRGNLVRRLRLRARLQATHSFETYEPALIDSSCS